MSTYVFVNPPDRTAEALAALETLGRGPETMIEWIPVNDAPLTRAERRRQAQQQPASGPCDEVRIDMSRSLIALVGNVIAVSTILGHVTIVHPDGERDTIEGPFYRYREGMDTVARIIATARQKAANK